ncbi:major facilitator superfamily domain-containing protein [Mycena amicta]|nr:major facilitator superfamily domain-containing protein [Mycena amicta]
MTSSPARPVTQQRVDSDSDGMPDETTARKAGSRWKRPAAWWLMIYAPFSMIVQTATAGASVELYTTLICNQVYPEPTSDNNLNSIPGPCFGDPTVQAEVAKLATVIATVTGILTFLTAAWWGSFSDRHGRTRMMGISAVGHTLGLLNIILVAKAVERIPGGYWFIGVNAVIMGVLGGNTSEHAAMHAYVADISTAEERSRIFSVVMGSMLIGVGVGPIIGSLILRIFHDPLSVFYFAVALRLIHTLFIWTVLPESLTEPQMRDSAARYHEDGRGLNSVYVLFKPLAIFWPKNTSSNGHRRNWNLFLLALADGVMLLAASSLISQFLYALKTFQWDGEYLGYCISSIGFTRAAFLAIVLPALIKFAKSRSKPASTSESGEQQPLLPDDIPSRPTSRASHFDLSLARFSIAVYVITFALLPFAPSSILFIVFISLGSFASGLAPAINSVALELYTHQTVTGLAGDDAVPVVESGKLYGALGVVQALFGNILGPPLYGLIYSLTVATQPKTVFFVALGNAVVALALLGLVRLPSRHPIPL